MWMIPTKFHPNDCFNTIYYLEIQNLSHGFHSPKYELTNSYGEPVHGPGFPKTCAHIYDFTRVRPLKNDLPHMAQKT